MQSSHVFQVAPAQLEIRYYKGNAGVALLHVALQNADGVDLVVWSPELLEGGTFIMPLNSVSLMTIVESWPAHSGGEPPAVG